MPTLREDLVTRLTCRDCHRRLTDPASQDRGRGPVCQAKHQPPPPRPALPAAHTDRLDHAALTAAGQLTIPTTTEP
ncbi:DUF6011 domain-containing protein [Streptomyces sp. NPDC059396]|uniref:DUF6011 domain-containing protein n=1 Tax=Streptomyces sp. NPDC059396 TaxID=3346819 RepID=UPI0036B1A0CE